LKRFAGQGEKIQLDVGYRRPLPRQLQPGVKKAVPVKGGWDGLIERSARFQWGGDFIMAFNAAEAAEGTAGRPDPLLFFSGGRTEPRAA